MISGKPGRYCHCAGSTCSDALHDGGFYNRVVGVSSNVVMLFITRYSWSGTRHTLHHAYNRRLNSISKICYCEVRILLITLL